jgi:hypothetical protein
MSRGTCHYYGFYRSRRVIILGEGKVQDEKKIEIDVLSNRNNFFGVEKRTQGIV